jgi:predicted porin
MPQALSQGLWRRRESGCQMNNREGKTEMQKKLLAVAVAGALLAPAAAMAQSSVTISGIFKVGVDNYRISDAPARTGNTNETRITDNSSRMIFGITEDLGGGLSGIAQLDARFQPDDAGGNFAETGNTWVGVRSASMGTLTFGRHDLHYGKQPDEVASLAGALQGAAVSLMDFIGTTAIANATRTPNVIRYDTPNWGGFAATVAFSTNGAGNEADLNSAVRKGSAWNFNPSYTSGPFQIGFSHWRSKADGVDAEQNSNSLYGYYRFGAFKVGLGFNQAETEALGVTTGDRNAWTIPVAWRAGQHHVAAHYTVAGDNDAVTTGDSGAKMLAVAYSYLLSKRTSMGVTYAKLTNDAGANYNFFTNTGGLGSTNSTLGLGEDGRLIAFTVRHAF